MKVTRDWLEATNHCPEGHAWGDMMVGAAGMELKDAVGLVERADWLLSLAVKTDLLTIEDACQLAQTLAREYIDHPQARALLPAALDPGVGGQELHALRHEAATVGYVATNVNNDVKLGFQASAVGFICLMRHEQGVELLAAKIGEEPSPERVLRYAQAVLVQLVASKTGTLLNNSEQARAWHMKLAQSIRERLRPTP